MSQQLCLPKKFIIDAEQMLSRSESEIEAAVLSAPWKTPSQYSAYVNAVRKSHKVNEARIRRNQDFISRMPQKQSLDRAMDAEREMRRVEELDRRERLLKGTFQQFQSLSRQQKSSTPNPTQRHVNGGTVPRRAQTPSLTLRTHTPLPTTGDAGWYGTSPPSTAPAPMLWKGDEITRQIQTREAQLEELNGNVDDLPLPPQKETTLECEEEEERAQNSSQRVKVGSTQHYVFDDEVGLIDIDNGSTDEDSASSDDFHVEDDSQTPKEPTAQQADEEDNEHNTEDDAPAALVVESNLEGLFQSGPREGERQDGRRNLMQMLLQVEQEAADLDDMVVAERQLERADKTLPPVRTVSQKPQVRKGVGHQSFAVFLSSQRPNGCKAIVSIEEERRRQLVTEWREHLESQCAHWARGLSSIRTREHMVTRRTQLIIDQESARRTHLAMRELASLEHIRIEMVLGGKKVEHMAKVHGRLDEKEETFARDQQRQRQLMEELAHKMLAEKYAVQSTNADIMVDNTDMDDLGVSMRKQSLTPAGVQRTSLSVATSAVKRVSKVLTNFYDEQKSARQRRKSNMIRRQSEHVVPVAEGSDVGTPGAEPFLAFSFAPGQRLGGDPSELAQSRPQKSLKFCEKDVSSHSAQGQKQIGKRGTLRKSSLWAPSPSVDAGLTPSDSSAFALPSPSQQSVTPPSNPLPSDAGTGVVKSLEEQKLEERWKNDAKKLSTFLQREMLVCNQPDYAMAYNEVVGLVEHGSAGVQQPVAVLATRDYLSSSNEGIEGEDNPVFLALREHESRMQTRNDERVAHYRSKSKKAHGINLSGAVDKLLQGKVRRATVFRESAGMTAVTLEQSRGFPSAADYSAYVEPPHRIQSPKNASKTSDISLAARIDEVLQSPKHKQGGTDLSLSQKALTGDAERIRQLDEHGAFAVRASFNLWSGEDQTPTTSSLSPPHGDVKSSHRQSSQQESSVDVSIGGLRRRNSSFFHLKNLHPEAPEDPEVAALQGDDPHASSTSSSTKTPYGRKRSNVASLILTSGLGRHNVESTRKSLNGDTPFYANQRSKRSVVVSPRPGGAATPVTTQSSDTKHEEHHAEGHVEDIGSDFDGDHEWQSLGHTPLQPISRRGSRVQFLVDVSEQQQGTPPVSRGFNKGSDKANETLALMASQEVCFEGTPTNSQSPLKFEGSIRGQMGTSLRRSLKLATMANSTVKKMVEAVSSEWQLDSNDF